MDRSECPTCGAPCTGETVPRGPHNSEYVLTYAPPPPAEQAGGELLEREVRYWLDNMPGAIRVREGAGDECLAKSFAVNVAALSQRPVVDEAAYTSDEVAEAMEVLRGRHGSTALHAEVLDDMERILTAALAPQQPEKGEG